MTLTQRLIVITLTFHLSVCCQDTSTFVTYDWNSQYVNYLLKTTDSVIDFDGNVYHTQKIGDQTWFIENLRVRHFNNGDMIIECKGDDNWIQSKKSSFCKVIGVNSFSCDTCAGAKKYYFKTDQIFYNQYVVQDTRNVCPTGYHVPSAKEYEDLITEIAIYYPVGEAISLDNFRRYEMDKLGFQEFPFGYRSSKTGEFESFDSYGYWWSSSIDTAVSAWHRSVSGYDLEMSARRWKNNSGLSIKCIQDD